jgi:hypothetical protein
MPSFDASSLQAVVLHHVGNRQSDEGFILSQEVLPLSEQLQNLLVSYFLTPFKAEEYYQLYCEEGPDENQIFRLAGEIFDDDSRFVPASQEVARRLYDVCQHPNIKSGDLFVVLFHDVTLNGETMDALGIFKSENKERFIKVQRSDEEWSRAEDDLSATASFSLEPDQGIDIHKLDKGAIIFNTERDKGFVVSVVDATNKGADALYWKDDFLHIRQRQDEYYNTHEVMQVCKQFVSKELPQQFEVSKVDQADIINKSLKFFKQNEQFDMEDFNRDVLAQPEVIDSFQQYKKQYEEDREVQIPEQFAINENAVKKNSRGLKSVIKLDKNFHIYVHGDRKLIEQGEDEKGKFYKVYYHEET